MKVTKEQFPQLVETYKGTIYSVCYMFSKDSDEVADLFQEVLMWLTDMSYEEIARIVGISVQNVSVKLVRIREKLKKM